jgi:sec-independent protein translocase protein TatA
MGIAGIGVWQLLIVLLIVIMLFGSKRLGSLGSDLGSAIRGFRDNVKGDGGSDSPAGDEPPKQAA